MLERRVSVAVRCEWDIKGRLKDTKARTIITVASTETKGRIMFRQNGMTFGDETTSERYAMERAFAIVMIQVLVHIDSNHPAPKVIEGAGRLG